MGILDKIKEAIFGVQTPPVAHNTTPQYSNHIPTYHIEDWHPKIKYPEYDKLFSLKKYLENINLPSSTISKVMNSSNPFGEAKNLFNGLKESVSWSDMCWRESERMERWIKVLSLWEAPTERILESTFMYLLLRLGWLCHWDASQQRALNINGLDCVLEASIENDCGKIVKFFDSDVLCCFALAHLRSEKNLTQIVDECFYYLDMNTTHNGSAHGSFYNLYGKEQIKGLIGKIIESVYTLNKFSTKKLFFKADDMVSVNTSSLKYDVSKMKSIRGFYLPNASDMDNIKNDVLQLNDYLAQSTSLVKSFPNIQIQADDLVFRFDKVSPDEATNFCTFIYAPNTPTGKSSKYPLKLGFYCRRTSAEKYTKSGNSLLLVAADGINGEIDYLANGELGKARIIITHKGRFYIINVLDKKGEKTITKIEGSSSNGERVVLYNANQK